MGNRRVIGFRESTDMTDTLYLYMHWGNEDVMKSVREIISHAEPRWSDASYANRMAIGYMLSEDAMGEYNFGISVNGFVAPDNDTVPIIVWRDAKVILTKAPDHASFSQALDDENIDQIIAEYTFDQVLDKETEFSV
jgi:hypothetical protein